MVVKKIRDNMYAIHMVKGEKMMSLLKEFAVQNSIGFAKISGIGAVCDVHLSVIKDGVYNPDKLPHKSLEIVSLQGNITLLNNSPFVHAHISLGETDGSYNIIGGHLVEATISLVGEIFVEVFDKEVTRSVDKETKMNTWDLENI